MHAKKAPLPEPAQTTDPVDSTAARRFLLTAPQMALWLDQALHPGKPIYNTGQIVTIEAAVDVGLFKKSLTAVVAEQDALRLRFVQRGAEIFQEAVDVLVPQLHVRDFSAEADPAAEAKAWLERLFWEPIAPTDFPLFRFALAKVGADRFLWLQAYHHLIIDATGRQLVAARTAAVYDKLAAGGPVPPAPGGSYRETKTRENAYLASAHYAADEDYWRKRFSDLPAPIVHRGAGLSEKSRSGRWVRLDAGLTWEESAALRSFANVRKSSLFKLILIVAWCCFSRLYRQDDLIFGVPLANRAAPSAKTIAGLFSTVMPFRLRLDAMASLDAALAQLNDELSRDLKHQTFPTDHINRVLELRKLNRGGLYDVVVNYVRNDYAFDLGGARIACTNLSAGFAVPWSIMALEYGSADAIQIVIDYDQGRIDPAEAAQFLRAFRSSLSHIIDIDDVAIEQLLSGADAVPFQFAEPAGHPARTGRSVSATSVAATAAPRPPRDDVDAALLGIWQKYFTDRNLGIEADYFDLGGDSLRAALLIGECNLQIGVDLPLSVLFERRTLERVADAFRECTGKQVSSCFVRLQEGNGGVPLLLVHPVGGSLFCYHDLITSLGKDVPVYGLHASGLGEGEHLPDSIEAMADQYVRAAAPIVQTGLHLAGWSFGGLVAFAIASRLAGSGTPAGSLTMIDTSSRPDFRSEDDDGAVRRLVASSLGVNLESPPGADLPTAVARIVAATASQAGSAGLTEDQVTCMFDRVRHARRLRRNYRPSRLSGGLTLFRAVLEPDTREQDFDWSELIDGPIDVVSLPATHESIVRKPHVDQVAAVLAKVISGKRVGALS